MCIDYTKNILYAQGWKGTLYIIDISMFENEYSNNPENAFEIIRNKTMNKEQTAFLPDIIKFKVRDDFLFFYL